MDINIVLLIWLTLITIYLFASRKVLNLLDNVKYSLGVEPNRPVRSALIDDNTIDKAKGAFTEMVKAGTLLYNQMQEKREKEEKRRRKREKERRRKDMDSDSDNMPELTRRKSNSDEIEKEIEEEIEKEGRKVGRKDKEDKEEKKSWDPLNPEDTNNQNNPLGMFMPLFNQFSSVMQSQMFTANARTGNSADTSNPSNPSTPLQSCPAPNSTPSVSSVLDGANVPELVKQYGPILAAHGLKVVPTSEKDNKNNTEKPE